MSLFVYSLLLSISVTNFMSNLKDALIIELLWPSLVAVGGFGELSAPNKAPNLQIEI